jgi:hypothetical protein
LLTLDFTAAKKIILMAPSEIKENKKINAVVYVAFYIKCLPPGNVTLVINAHW